MERAELMTQSRLTGGMVVCAKPLRKFGSLDLQAAEVNKFEGVLLSPADLCELAFRRAGVVGSDTYERAMSILASFRSSTGF